MQLGWVQMYTPQTASNVTSVLDDGRDYRAHKIGQLGLGGGAASGLGQSVYISLIIHINVHLYVGLDWR